MNPRIDLDQEKVSQLACAIGDAIKAHLAQQPHSRVQVLEALNALALHVALVVQGSEPETLQFFQYVLANQLKAFSAGVQYGGTN